MQPAKKTHWETIYSTKQPNEVSWTQIKPGISLDFIRSFNAPKDASIIDIGGGDSRLVDYLLEDGYTNITVLDISENALNRAKARLGSKAQAVHWIVSDITEFRPDQKYDVWHDRATFHFLRTEQEIDQYLAVAAAAANHYLVIGTFSEHGPDRCSSLPVRQYNEDQLTNELNKYFDKMRCIHDDHVTPFNTVQNFLFCSFQKRP